MNEVDIIELGKYKIQDGCYTQTIYVVKVLRIRKRFRVVDGLIINTISLEKEYRDLNKTMTLKEFKKRVLYKID